MYTASNRTALKLSFCIEQRSYALNLLKIGP